MKLSENKTIKVLNIISTGILGLYIIFLIIKLISPGSPAASNSVKGFSVYDMVAKPKDLKHTRTLEDWFSSKVIVEPTYKAFINLRIKSNDELYSFPSLLFQFSNLIYWLAIGYLLLCVKMLFSSFSKNKVFTTKNANLITSGAIVMLALPVIRWATNELFINLIVKMNLNDSSYAIQNQTGISGSETLIGIALLAFGLAFRAGVDLKNENEAFI